MLHTLFLYSYMLNIYDNDLWTKFVKYSISIKYIILNENITINNKILLLLLYYIKMLYK